MILKIPESWYLPTAQTIRAPVKRRKIEDRTLRKLKYILWKKQKTIGNQRCVIIVPNIRSSHYSFPGITGTAPQACCHGYISSTEKNLISLAKKAFDNIPAEISAALRFINPHYTLVKSVYTAAFADDIYEKAKMVAAWVFSQSSYIKFDLDPK